MLKINFNKNWEFAFDKDLDTFASYGFAKYSEATGAASRFLNNNNFKKVTLPHDWAVALPKNMEANAFAGGRANSHFHRLTTELHNNVDDKDIYEIGWYRKQFNFQKEWEGKKIFLEFEGIFRDAIIWVNGTYMTRHTSGYTGLVLDITDHLHEGENSVAVRVDSDQTEGWWYEGSGIYRNVNLYVTEPVHFKFNKTQIISTVDGKVNAKALLLNDTEEIYKGEVRWSVLDGETVVAETVTKVELSPYCEGEISAELFAPNAKLWDLDTPNLYTLKIEAADTVTETFGFRTAVFDADKGFLLNGRVVKIHGACVHQDFGGVGVALTDNLIYYKLKRLKEMGVNAYRSSHHAPSPVLLKYCDELGIMVMDETRLFGTSPEAVKQLTDLVERDRNHPSIVIWSIGNEEFSIQNTPFSRHLLKKATAILKKLDGTRAVTYGNNEASYSGGCSDIAEVRGINYIRNGKGDWIGDLHKRLPNQPIVGTEEASFVLSRGGHVNDLSRGMLDCTGNAAMLWGTIPRSWVQYTEETPYFAGSFMWTGFDYRGEGNPFIYTNIGSSFGTIDLCGMEKPTFYYYKAWWTDEPVIKLLPHWNYKEGETAKITVFTNCQSIELFVNGKSVAKKNLEKFEAPCFEIPFTKGVLKVVGERNGVTFTDEIRTSEKCTEIKASDVYDCGEDGIGIIELNGYDENGVFCPLASNKVKFTLNSGEIVGVGNGDPADFNYEQREEKEEVLFIRHFADEKGMFAVPSKDTNVGIRRYDTLVFDKVGWNTPVPWLHEENRFVAGYEVYDGEPTLKTLTTTLSDVDGFKYVEFERLGGDTEIFINGEKIGDNLPKWRAECNLTRPYRFYYDFGEGEYELKLVCKIYSTSASPRNAVSGYVKLGKPIDEPWEVKLHFGKARIFVKGAKAENVKIIK